MVPLCSYETSRKNPVLAFIYMHFVNSLDHCRKEVVIFLSVLYPGLHNSSASPNLKVPIDSTRWNTGDGLCWEAQTYRMQMWGCIHSLSESSLSSFLHSSFSYWFSTPVSDRLFFHSGPGGWGLGAGGRRAYRSTLSAEGKGMWATPILWAVSKQPLCNLWLGEVVHGERAACLLSVGLHKCVFQIRVGGHVWLHGHNDFPHSYTFGQRILAFHTVCIATLNQSIFLHQNVSFQTFFHVLPVLQQHPFSW